MDSEFGRCISSSLFTFQIGPAKTKFTLHSYPIGELSPALFALLNGDMVEASTRLVEWDDVDEDTFVRLCEFAYHGHYTPPKWEKIPLPPRETPRPAESNSVGPADDSWPHGFTVSPNSRKRGKDKKKTYPSFMWGEWTSQPVEVALGIPTEKPEPEPEYGIPQPQPNEGDDDGDLISYGEKSIGTRYLRNTFQPSILLNKFVEKPRPLFPRSNASAAEDFTPVFVGHARLYILADKYGIDDLRRLVLQKLFLTLKNFKLYEQSWKAVMDLVRFAYSDRLSGAESIAELKNLVTQYVVSIVGWIRERSEFRELLMEGGPFVSDFWELVWK